MPRAARPDLYALSGIYLWALGRTSDSVAAITAALRFAEDNGDEIALANVKVVIATGAVARATPGAEEAVRHALAVAREAGDPELEWAAAYTLVGIVSITGRPLESAPLMAELRALTTAMPPAMLTHLLWYEGTQARMEGRINDSLQRYEELESLWQRGAAVPQTIARAGNALTAFAAGIPDPDEDRLDLLLHDAQADDDRQGTALFHVRLGLRALRTGDLAVAQHAFDAVRAEMPDTLWALWADAGLVDTLDALDNRSGAKAAIDRLRVSGHPLRLVQADLGEASIAVATGEPLRAQTTAHRALTTAVEHGLVGEIPDLLEVLADADTCLGDNRGAARLIGAAQRLRDERGVHGRHQPRIQRLAATIERAREALGHDDFDRGLADGSAMDWTEAIAYAQRTRGKRGRPNSGWEAITPTEHKVIDAVADGLSNSQIAAQLLMGTETVKSHLTSIYTKLGVRNRAQLTAAALRP